MARHGTSADPYVVESRSVEQTAFTYETIGGEKLLVSYVENGVTWTIDRDTDGSILSITSA